MGRNWLRPRRREPSLGDALPEHRHADPLQVHEADERERGGQAHGVPELVRRAVVHRAARVEEEVDAEILLVDEDLQVEAVEPGERVPVDVAQIVTDLVRPVVRELDARARGAGSSARP